MIELKKFLPHLPTIIACALIVIVGIIYTVHSSPGTTTIGQDISTGNITASNLSISGNATTSGNLVVSGSTSLATTTATVISEGGSLLSSKYIPPPPNATTGDVLYYNGTNWARLGTGTSGQFLQSQGSGSNPQWATVSAGLTGFYTIPRANKSATTTNEWVDVDVSDIVPVGTKAVSVLFHANAGWSYDLLVLHYGARKNGSTDEGTYLDLSGGSEYLYSSRTDIIELDANRVFEQKIDTTLVKIYITGYLK